MLHCCRITAGLIAVWALFLGVLTVWPSAPDAGISMVRADNPRLAVRAEPTDRYMHTGLWVADMQPDGTVVYLRQIKRR